MEKILTVTNVAEILQVKAITVREMFREKRLRGFKVGKSWRTTETMLREDIDALARGESPAELPMPNNAAPATPKSPVATATPAVSAAPPAKEAAPPAKAPAAPAAERPAAPPKARPARKPVTEPDDTTDDTQQLLF